MVFKHHIYIFLISIGFMTCNARDTLSVGGQLSAFGLYNNGNDLSWWTGARYIPRLNYEYHLKTNNLLDIEGALNSYGTIGAKPCDSSHFDSKVKPYRLWFRYSNPQFELRAGLQKINFGSASLLRPLMWFDRIDPSDPLKLTDGVWGILARYYFLNNANLWFWTLCGNKDTKGWEVFPTEKNTPEFGGRAQVPVPHGESGFSYHHRTVDCSGMPDSLLLISQVSENRYGFDVKFDMVLGWWIEASWFNYQKLKGLYANQEILNFGLDYTFGIGNGLSLIFEYLLVSKDESPFEFQAPISFSLVNLSYPIGIFDSFNATVYYDWTNNKVYNFLQWERKLNLLTFYVMGFINPGDYKVPGPSSVNNLYAGNGIQLMIVFNH